MFARICGGRKLEEQNVDSALISTTYNRVFKPAHDSVLYHYCSTGTLLSILEHEKLRFSDVK